MLGSMPPPTGLIAAGLDAAYRRSLAWYGLLSVTLFTDFWAGLGDTEVGSQSPD